MPDYRILPSVWLQLGVRDRELLLTSSGISSNSARRWAEYEDLDSVKDKIEWSYPKGTVNRFLGRVGECGQYLGRGTSIRHYEGIPTSSGLSGMGELIPGRNFIEYKPGLGGVLKKLTEGEGPYTKYERGDVDFQLGNERN